ncbi:amino acid permease [Sporosarcina sp. ANT_H38]|uniref:APC family permease n=1 Tax=Sporosarcina sp. ANT_H38 TaxID=2597358 RepID=UPI0011F0A480|nr:APC family permease [Sporosarcina sp. ANT_H38]KAA0966327.1 amino acid permease [Sporosarcina sp. ANT_H38]
MERQTLIRTLTLSQVVFLGIAWNNPMVFFNTYGIATVTSQGVIMGAYVVAFLAILFTAFSYGKMAKAFPIAGSAYTFTQKSINPQIGFLVGWTIMLDYMLTPMVTCLMSTVFLHAVFPEIPHALWIIILTATIAIPSILGVKFSAFAGKIFVIAQVIFVGVFWILTAKSLMAGVGAGTLFSIQPLFNNDIELPVILAGASILCFSFLGFDSLTTLSEETINPEKTIPRAIIIMLVTIGVLYIGSAYLAQLVHPGFLFENTDSAAMEVVFLVGGNLFQSLFVTAVILGNFSSGVASTTSASRVLYAMGRDSVLPKKVFGHIHSRFKTPSTGIIVIGIISLLGIVLTLDQVIKFINFGALIAFTSVNLSVIAHYFIRNRKRSSFNEYMRYLFMPLLGAGFTLWLWSHLELDAMILGGIWVACGFVYLLYMTKFFKQQLPEFSFDKEIIPEEEMVPEVEMDSEKETVPEKVYMEKIR